MVFLYAEPSITTMFSSKVDISYLRENLSNSRQSGLEINSNTKRKGQICPIHGKDNMGGILVAFGRSCTTRLNPRSKITSSVFKNTNNRGKLVQPCINQQEQNHLKIYSSLSSQSPSFYNHFSCVMLEVGLSNLYLPTLQKKFFYVTYSHESIRIVGLLIPLLFKIILLQTHLYILNM